MKPKICPYPGLRPFTEEESIFFKGRDLHIRQVINQLEERKFVMITGASGDGKSSLVYAGVIPNASAGFFHAEYNNWLFVDFRPEKAPLQNLANVLSDKLELDKDLVSEKLQYGFSSIINLYKSSKFYIDKESEEWKLADNVDKKHIRNKSANLFILADQFEEFFTNQENFNKGKPSTSAYTTVNLLLETARISMNEKLPVFIVFTMRSDFISQCVAFKNLPEFIGYSQFFIPRLKRNELQQVIEEPALLSGGKLSSRLVEVLINDLREGFDQLPVLQHNLNSLWNLANNGEDEIDLIHLAKLGGMSSRFLNEQDKTNFNQWFSTIEDYKKSFYENLSLANVLNSHANELYLTAYNNFQKNIKWADKNINEDDAKFIIKTTFQCLTKIDEGRAVRNRMTLAEITRIINKPHITTDIVCGVMNIFRLPSSTFIRPFIDENDIATQYLSIESVWDITHEALIRNWEILIKWEEEEYQNLANFRDFTTQLNRWLDNEKSDNFLLAAGNLKHFEDWYAKSNLNLYWIAKYDNSDVSAQKRIEKSRELAQNTELFLTESRKFITHFENQKKRRRSFAFAMAIFLIVVLSGFTFWALTEKSKAEEQKKIALEETKKAEEAKIKADENANAAQIAKLQSDSARTLAEQMTLLAQEKTNLAIIESQKALSEKNRADKQLIIAEEQRTNAEQQKTKAEQQRLIAEEQKTIAEVAKEKSQKLSVLAIAQNLTFKSAQIYSDKQINLLLSYYSFLINKENGGDERDAAIYIAMNNALDAFGISPIVFTSTQQISSIDILSDNTFDRISTSGEFTSVDLKTLKTITTKTITSDLPINQSFILDDKVLLSYEDYSLVLWDMNTDEQIKLKGHTDFVRAAIIIMGKNFLVTGSRDNTVKIWDLYLKRNKEIESIVLNAKVTNIVISPDENYIYIACSNGELISLNLATYDKTTLLSSGLMISSLCLSPNNKYLIAGTTTGKLKIINLVTNKTTDFEVGSSKIDAIAVDNNSELLAVATSNKFVNIYQLENTEAKPFILDGFSKKITTLHFAESGKLYGFSEDNNLYEWETDNEHLAKNVLENINRNLTQAEWNKHIGSDIEFRELDLK